MSTQHSRYPGHTNLNDEPHHLWNYLKRGQIQQFLLALIPSKRATANAASLECPPTPVQAGQVANAPVVHSALTQSQNYTEVLTLRMVPALAGHLTLQVHSRLSTAADPTQWRLRHQVIMQRSDVFKLRDAIDQFLAVSVSIEEA